MVVYGVRAQGFREKKMKKTKKSSAKYFQLRRRVSLFQVDLFRTGQRQKKTPERKREREREKESDSIEGYGVHRAPVQNR